MSKYLRGICLHRSNVANFVLIQNNLRCHLLLCLRLQSWRLAIKACLCYGSATDVCVVGLLHSSHRAARHSDVTVQHDTVTSNTSNINNNKDQHSTEASALDKRPYVQVISLASNHVFCRMTSWTNCFTGIRADWMKHESSWNIAFK